MCPQCASPYIACTFAPLPPYSLVSSFVSHLRGSGFGVEREEREVLAAQLWACTFAVRCLDRYTIWTAMFVATHNGPQFVCGQAPPGDGPMDQRGTYAIQGEESLDLFYSLAVSIALSTGRRFVSRVIIELEYPLHLKDPTPTANLETREKLLTRHCVHVLTFMVAHTDDHTRFELKQQLHMMDSIAKLQNNFKVFLSCSKYDDPTCRYALLTSTIGAFFTNRNNESIPACHGNGPRQGPISCSSLEKLMFFGSLLSFEEVEVVGEIVLHAFSLRKVKMGLRLCRALPESHRGDGVTRVLMSAGLTLCKMLERGGLVEVSSGLNLPLEILELSRLALCSCSPDQLLECAEFCNVARIAAAVSEQCQTEDLPFSDKTLGASPDQFVYEKFAFEDEFNEDGIVLNATQTIPVVYEITNIIGPQLPHIIGIKCPLKCSAFVGRSAGSAEEDFQRLERPIDALVCTLQKSSQMQLILMVLVNFQLTLQTNFSANMQCQALAQKLYSNSWLTKQKDTWHSCYEDCNEITKQATLSLIQKVLNSRVVDINLALSYCLLLPAPLAFEKLWLLVNSAQHNYRKILFIAEVGENLAHLHQQVEQRERFLELATDANWGLKTSKLGVSFHSVFRAAPSAKAALIPDMVASRGLDSTMLIQFCRTFEVDCDSALKDYIESLLLRQGQETVHSDSSTEPLITQEERAQNVKDAFVIISQLENKHNLVFSLMGQLHKLSAYDYESIELVLKAISLAGLEATDIDVEQALELLQHLYSYNRVSKVEEQEWVSEFAPLPPVADKRLPFHPLFFNTNEYFWKLIGKELTVQTLPTLKLITSLMKMPLDKLHMLAVKYVFQNSLKPKMFQQPTVMAQTHSGSLRIKKDILAIIKQIQSYIFNINQHEYKNAATNYIVQNLSPGPVKVHAMHSWVRMAQKWMLSLPQGEEHKNAETSLQKIKTECLRTATESALLQHSLHDQDLVKLIGRPARLICKLYEHPSITQRLLQPLGHSYPDIHALATEIAEINETNLDKIKMMMQQTLLTENQQKTFYEITSLNLLWDIPEENMSRLIYLLQALPPDDGAHFLFTVADLTFSDVSVTYGQRARALRCLLHIADSKTIEKVTHKSMEQLWCYLKSCVYLSKLESLNIPYTFEAFQSSSKEGIIKGLWKNHNQEPHAVQLVAQLSLDYAISDANLWAGVLQKLFTYGLLNQLGEVLVKLNSFKCMWQIPNLARMWTAAILTPLMEVLSLEIPEQQKSCRQSFLLLLRCPVLADLDILAFGKRFALAGQPALALASLLLVPVGADRRKQIQDLLTNCCLDTLLSQAMEDVCKGDFSVLAKQVIKIALEQMVKTGETHIKATQLPLIKDFVIGEQRIRVLLEHLIERGWDAEVLRLIAEQLKHSGKSVPQGVSPLELLKRFLDKSDIMP
uniref:kinetochore-associated protein 1-like isoform X2 n=1 Tax=Myxine glutinosa TaxID=7769 RepID=UPI00358F6FEC